MSYKYIYDIEADLSKVSSEVKETIDSVNKTMEEFGFHEKMIVRQVIHSFVITTDEALTPDKIETIRTLAHTSFREKFPSYDICVRFRSIN